MQDTITIRGRRVSARQIIAAKTGETGAGDCISEVSSERLIWAYRRHTDDQGILTDGSRTCSADDADCIGIDYAGEGIVTLRLTRHGGRRQGAGRKVGPLGRAVGLPLRVPVAVYRALETEAKERGVLRSELAVEILTRSLRARGRL